MKTKRKIRSVLTVISHCHCRQSVLVKNNKKKYYENLNNSSVIDIMMLIFFTLFCIERLHASLI